MTHRSVKEINKKVIRKIRKYPFHCRVSRIAILDLRDAKTGHWCSSMLRGGITATLGPVAEPYLHTFPRPDEFFAQLLSGKQLVEAYYRTKPYNSWQMILIGDPLYKPFPK